MNCIISDWSRHLIILASFIGFACLTNSCSGIENDADEALIPSKEKRKEENVSTYLKEGLCKNEDGNYMLILLHPAECESCYPVIREHIVKYIRSMSNCRILLVLPKLISGIKQNLIEKKLGIDTSRVIIMENTAVYHFLLKKMDSLQFSTSSLLEVSPSGEIISRAKVSPK